MPYARETAGKGGHSDFVRNPDVTAFLEKCTYLREPSEFEAKAIGALYKPAPSGATAMLPRYVLASDASKSDTPITDNLPSTQVGFLKVSHVLVDMQKYEGLINPSNRFVNPFKAAEIHREGSPITFTMPGSNVRYGGHTSVKDGFRQALFDQLSIDRSEKGAARSLAQVLVELEVGGALIVESCPCCRIPGSFAFTSTELTKRCSACDAVVYATDSLRLHEGISDFGDNSSAMTRMMNAIEHLMLAAFIIELKSQQPGMLSELFFVMDGPLAIFGEPAKLSQRLQRLICEVNRELVSEGRGQMLVLGLQKTGGLMDHAKLLEKYLPKGSLRVVDDDYRNTYITGGDSPAANFGNETYYGQDFIFRTERGRIFNFAIPYPFPDKSYGGGGAGFAKAKIEISRYGNLIRQACDLIRHFEMDLYESAIVPVALAHRHASISLVPGGKVLDVMVRSSLKGSVEKA